MRIDRMLRAAQLSGIGLMACTSSALRPDLGAVQTHSKVSELPKLPEAKVRVETEAAARALLEAPLDADAAVRIAIVNNRELRANLRELGIERGRLMQAGLIANPTFEAELLPERDSNLELRVEYDLTSLIFAPLQKRSAERDLESVRLASAARVVELGYRTRLAFYAYQAALHKLAISQRALDALAAARDAANALYDAGNLPQLDAARQVVAYERARIDVAELELEAVELREALQRVLGLSRSDGTWTVAPELVAPQAEHAVQVDLERLALEANLDLQAAERRLDALARRTGVTRWRGLLPEVAFDVHALHTDPEPGSSDAQEWRWGGGVSVEVPLFDRRQGELRSYEAEFDALLERYQGQAIDIRSSAREVSARFQSAERRERQLGRVIVPAQRTILEQTLLQYNAMQLDVFDLLDAQAELREAELTHVNTLRDYWSARAELEALLAGKVVSRTPDANGAPGQRERSAAGGH
jgi:outer membrane protein TolC